MECSALSGTSSLSMGRHDLEHIAGFDVLHIVSANVKDPVTAIDVYVYRRAQQY